MFKNPSLLLYICSMFLKRIILFFLCFPSLINSQYTDQINSNRPGASVGAFSVGKNVIQSELGFSFRKFTHSGYNNSTFDGGIGFLSLRWGFISEKLELLLDSKYLKGYLVSKLYTIDQKSVKQGFLGNFIGFKYLLFDPFRKEKETNVYSWKANNGFKLREMIPAVSLTLGTNINFEKNNPFPYNNIFGNLYRPIFFQNLEIKPDQEPFFHFGGTIATQSHFLGTWVFVTNFNYSRYLTKYPEMSYILTLTHTLDSYWSVYIENQAFKSDLFQDFIFRFGTAYLLSNDIQLEATFGASTKNTPSSILANIGVSYRLDFHKDFISAEEKQEKEFRKQEKNLNKSLKKSSKQENKRNRKAKRN